MTGGTEEKREGIDGNLEIRKKGEAKVGREKEERRTNKRKLRKEKE